MVNKRHLKAVFGLTVLLLGGSFQGVRAQDDESKAIKAEEFIRQRPSKGPTRSATPPKYRRRSNIAARATPPPGMVFAQLGVTIWRFRPSTTADKTKELIEEDGENKEVTLERIEEGTPVLPGQKIRRCQENPVSLLKFLGGANRF